MQSMNISLPEPLKEFVDGRIAAGRYSSASEQVREFIRADEKRKAEERLETLPPCRGLFDACILFAFGRPIRSIGCRHVRILGT